VAFSFLGQGVYPEIARADLEKYCLAKNSLVDEVGAPKAAKVAEESPSVISLLATNPKITDLQNARRTSQGSTFTNDEELFNELPDLIEVLRDIYSAAISDKDKNAQLATAIIELVSRYNKENPTRHLYLTDALTPTGIGLFKKQELEKKAGKGEWDELNRIANDKSETEPVRNYARQLLLNSSKVKEAELFLATLKKRTGKDNPKITNIYTDHTVSGPKTVAKTFTDTAKQIGMEDTVSEQGIELDDDQKKVRTTMRYKLQGESGDLDTSAWDAYIASCKEKFNAIRGSLADQDVIILHDHDFLGMVDLIKSDKQLKDKKIIWHCHLDLDKANPVVWRKLRGFVNKCDVVIMQPRNSDKMVMLRRRLGIKPPVIFMPPAALNPAGKKFSVIERVEMGKIGRAIALKLQTGGQPVFDIAKDKYFLTMGRLDMHKGYHRAILSFRDAFKDMDPGNVPHLVIAFPEAEKEVKAGKDKKICDLLSDAIKKVPEGLRSKIHLLPIPEEHNEQWESALQQNAMAGLQLSVKEGFGLFTAEMALRGKPVIGTRRGGIETQIADGLTGYLVSASAEPKNATDITAAQRMRDVWESESSHNTVGENARVAARQRYVSSSLVANYFSAATVAYDAEGTLLGKEEGTDVESLNKDIWTAGSTDIQKDVLDSLSNTDTSDEAQKAKWTALDRLDVLKSHLFKLYAGDSAMILREKLEQFIKWKAAGKMQEDISVTAIGLPFGALNKIGYQETNNFRAAFYGTINRLLAEEASKNPQIKFSAGFARTTFIIACTGIDNETLSKIIAKAKEDALLAAGVGRTQHKNYEIYAGQAVITDKKLRDAEIITSTEVDHLVMAKRIGDFIENNVRRDAVGAAETAEKNTNVRKKLGEIRDRTLPTTILTEADIETLDQGKGKKKVRSEVTKRGDDKVLAEQIYSMHDDGNPDPEHGTTHRPERLLKRIEELILQARESLIFSPEKDLGDVTPELLYEMNKLFMLAFTDLRYPKSLKFDMLELFFSDQIRPDTAAYVEWLKTLRQKAKDMPNEEAKNRITKFYDKALAFWDSPFFTAEMGDEMYLACKMEDGSYNFVFLELDKFNALNQKYKMADGTDPMYHRIIDEIRKIAKNQLGSKSRFTAADLRTISDRVQREVFEISVPVAGGTHIFKKMRFPSNEKVNINGSTIRPFLYRATIKKGDGTEERIDVVKSDGRYYRAEGKAKYPATDVTDLVTKIRRTFVTRPNGTVTRGVTDISVTALGDRNTEQKGKGIRVAEDAEIMSGEILTTLEKEKIAHKIDKTWLADEIRTALVTGTTADDKKAAVIALVEKLKSNGVPNDRFFACLAAVHKTLSQVMPSMQETRERLLYEILDDMAISDNIFTPNKTAQKGIGSSFSKRRRAFLAAQVRAKERSDWQASKDAELTLLETIKSLAKLKGVNSDYVESIFETLSQGLDVLIMYPELDEGQIDENYFLLVDQLEKLTDIPPGTILTAFNRIVRGKDEGFQIASRTSAVTVLGSPLEKLKDELTTYNAQEAGKDKYELADASEKVFLTELKETTAGKKVYLKAGAKQDLSATRNSFLSGIQAVRRDLKKIVKTVSARSPPVMDFVNDRTPSAVIVDYEDVVFEASKMGDTIDFRMSPCIEAVLKQLEGTQNKLAVRVASKDMEFARIIFSAANYKERIVLIETDGKSITEQEAVLTAQGIQTTNIVWLSKKAPADDAFKGRLQRGETKYVQFDKDSTFHSTLLFGFLYAKSPAVTGNQIPSETHELIWQYFKVCSDNKDDKTIRDAIEALKTNGWLNVKFVSIKETLKILENTKLYVDTAA